MNRALGLLLACMVAMATSGAGAEDFAFERPTPKGPLALHGQLWLPPGTDKVPVMILSHGSGGLSPTREPRYAEALNAMGVGVYAIDHFGPRGISPAHDQFQFSDLAMVADDFAALDALAAHPRVDADRVGLTGFSKGGAATWRAALTRFNGPRGAGAHRFALFVAYYPGACGTRYHDLSTIGAPIRFLLGSDDNSVGWAGCIELASAIRAAGGDVESKIFEGAGHGFDMIGEPYWQPDAATYKDCIVEELSDGRWWERGSGIVYQPGNPEGYRKATSLCVHTGVGGGPDPRARAESLDLLKQYVAQYLLPAPPKH